MEVCGQIRLWSLYAGGKISGTHWELKGSEIQFETFVDDNNSLLLSVPWLCSPKPTRYKPTLSRLL